MRRSFCRGSAAKAKSRPKALSGTPCERSAPVDPSLMHHLCLGPARAGGNPELGSNLLFLSCSGSEAALLPVPERPWSPEPLQFRSSTVRLKLCQDSVEVVSATMVAYAPCCCKACRAFKTLVKNKRKMPGHLVLVLSSGSSGPGRRHLGSWCGCSGYNYSVLWVR